jgi:EF hand
MRHGTIRSLLLAGPILAGLHGGCLAATGPSGQEIPDPLRGAWYTGQACSNVSGYVFHGPDWELFVSGSQGSYTSLFSPLRIESIAPDGSVVVRAFRMDPATERWTAEKFAWKLDAGGITSAFTSGPPHETHAIRCANPQQDGKNWLLYSYFLSDLTNLLTSFSAIQHDCGGDQQACAADLMQMLDADKDGKIAPAEIVNFLRRASKLGPLVGKNVSGTDVITADFTLDQVIGAELGMAVVGPVIANVVMANFDYNGDGFIEASELALVLQQLGLPANPGTLAGLVASARDSAARAFKSLDALQQLLGVLGRQ